MSFLPSLADAFAVRRSVIVFLVASLLTVCVASTSFALSPSNGNLVVADTTNGRLIRVDFAGGVSDVITSGGLLDGSSAVAVDRRTGSIYTTNQLEQSGPGIFARIIKVATPSLTQSLVADGRGSDAVFGGVDGALRHPRHLDFEAGGTLVVAERSFTADGQTGRNGIVRFDPANTNLNTNTTDVRVGTFSDPGAIIASPQGNLFLGDLSGANDLWYVPANGASQTLLDGLITGDVAGVGGLTIGATDGAGHVTSLFVAEIGAGRVSRVDLVYSGDNVTSGVRTTISTGTGGNPFAAPLGVVYDEIAGYLYATDASQTGVYRIANPFGAASTTYLDIVAASGGSITASGMVLNGIDVFYSFPVPEPSTFALLGLGFVGVAVKSRRRHRAAA